MAKNKKFTVILRVTLETDVEVNASSFEEALQKAKELTATDIVSFEGSHNDSSVEITGIFG